MPALAIPPLGPLPTEQLANGCFETMRAYQGRIFRLEAHLDRLGQSAQYLGLNAMIDRPRLQRALLQALRASGLGEAIVRVALLPRPGASGRLASAGALAQRVLPSIVVQPVQPPTHSAYRTGIRVAIVPTKKFPVSAIDPQAKHSARLSSILATMEAQLRGADEALVLDALGSVTESTASNVGIVTDGVICTPPCWVGLLAGITRDVLEELAAELRIPLREAPLTRHDLYTADEAFLSSTIKEVLAITMVDGRTIGTGRPGPVTRQLRHAFQELVKKEVR